MWGGAACVMPPARVFVTRLHPVVFLLAFSRYPNSNLALSATYTLLP